MISRDNFYDLKLNGLLIGDYSYKIILNNENNKKKINNDSNYTVKKGDTLYSISKKHKISVDDIMKKNNLKNNNLIIGQKLKI